MRKINTPDQLRSELQGILAYAQSSKPARSRLASAIKDLAERTAGAFDGVQSAAYEFYLRAEKHWAHLTYTGGAGESGKGTVRIAHLGVVQFREASNDRAVVVDVPAIFMKASPEQVMKALNAISKIVGNTSL